jgi:hypothetical protein
MTIIEADDTIRCTRGIFVFFLDVCSHLMSESIGSPKIFTAQKSGKLLWTISFQNLSLLVQKLFCQRVQGG